MNLDYKKISEQAQNIDWDKITIGEDVHQTVETLKNHVSTSQKQSKIAFVISLVSLTISLLSLAAVVLFGILELNN